MSLILEAVGQVASSPPASPAESVAVLAAEGSSGYTAPNVDWDVGEEMQETARTFAFFLAVIWLAFFVGKFLLPKKNGGMNQSRGMGASFAGAAVGILILLDLSLVPKFVNWILEAIWWAGSLIGVT